MTFRFAFVAALLLATPAFGQIAHDPTTTPAVATLTAVASDDPTGTTASFTPPANAVLTIRIACDTGTGVSPTITVSGASLTYNQRVYRSSSEGTSGVVAIYTALVGASPGAMTVTVTVNNIGPAGSDRGWFWVDVWTGVSNTDEFGDDGEGSSTTSNITPTAIVTTVSGSRTIGVAGDWNAAGVPTTSDVGTGQDTAIYAAIPAYKAVNSSGIGTNVTLNFNGGGAGRDWNWAAIELLPDAAPPAAAKCHGALIGVGC